MIPRTIEITFADDKSCVKQLTVFPHSLKSASESYELSIEGVLSVGDVALVGRSVCAKPLSAPTTGTQAARLSFNAISFPALYFTITTPELPSVDLGPIKKPIAAARPLALDLSANDVVFDYALASGDQSAACEAAEGVLVCDTTELQLTQGTTQQLQLERRFADKKTATIFEGTVEVLPAVAIVDSSIKEGQTVYAKNQPLTITVDKPLKNAKVSLGRRNGETTEPYAVTVKTSDAAVTITPNEADLPRASDYVLTLTEVEAEDGSGLAGPHAIHFALSDGPKVSSVSMGATGIEPNARIMLTLDQARKADQNITDLVKVTGVQATVTATNDAVYVALAGASRCASFTITLSKEIMSEHDVKASEDWTFKGRTRCHTIEAVGYSAGGRAINAYIYGNGATTYLYAAGIHGNELSSVYTIQSWMNELEANPGKIPANARVVVIPRVSPDGVARAARDNNNGVNLNRNFPTYNWTSNIVTGGGEQAGAGGSAAGSEPETKALMNATYRYAPRFVITYHSSGSLVNSNDVGVSIAAGRQYAQLARYWFIPNSQTTATFGFEMTGTYEDWLLERGTAAILIELNTNGGNHFSQNRSAMWAMLGY